MRNKQIAGELEISESAVRLYRAEAKRKLGVTSAAELTGLFARLGGLATGGG
jgi:DNA-binding NarL/FixJ family response regulator